jgi:hypothetical protein
MQPTDQLNELAAWLAHQGVESLAQDRTASVDSHQRDLVRPRVLLDDLVCDPHQGAAQIVAVEDDLVVSVDALAPSWPLWTGLKEPTARA